MPEPDSKFSGLSNDMPRSRAARTQFRDLNELRNVDESGDGLMTKAKNNQFILITMTQKMVDTPTWIGAYRKAEDDGAVVQLEDGSIDDSKAVAMAYQAVHLGKKEFGQHGGVRGHDGGQMAPPSFNKWPRL